MQFSSLSEFLAMGGYAFNVWSVYALFVIVFAIVMLLPLQRKKKIIREQKRRLLLNPGAAGQHAQDGSNNSIGGYQ